MRIKTRNFAREAKDWIMSMSGLGPGIGKIFYLVEADSAYETILLENGVKSSEMANSLAAGEDLLTTDRNDVLFALPGVYTETATTTWDKNQTHLIGLGGPNQRYCPTTPTNGAVMIKTVTANVDSILNITGHYCQFHGFQTQNTLDDADNVCDIKVSGKNAYLRGIHARGGNGAAQLGAVAGVPLYLNSAAAGGYNGFLAEDCIFGTSGNSARATGPGAVYCKGGAAGGFNPVFRNCVFEMRCETSGSSNPKLVHLADNYAVDRVMEFDHCLFYSFWENLGGKMDYAIVDACATTHQILLRGGCSLLGIDKWCNVATYCFTTDPLCHTNGGEALAVDETV